MTEDWRSETRLPDDPGYWDDLAARSIDAALQRTPAANAGEATAASGRATATAPWWRGVSDAAFLLAASAALALLGGTLLLDEPSPRATPHAAAIAGALAPDDPLLRTLLNAPAEPQAGALLRLVALREEGR